MAVNLDVDDEDDEYSDSDDIDGIISDMNARKIGDPSEPTRIYGLLTSSKDSIKS